MLENGTIHITMMKNWVSHIRFLRKTAYRISGSAEKGAFRVVTPPPPESITAVPGVLDAVNSLRVNGLENTSLTGGSDGPGVSGRANINPRF